MTDAIFGLPQPFGGIVTEPFRIPVKNFYDSSFVVSGTSVCNLSELSVHAKGWDGSTLDRSPLSGVGCDLDWDVARLKAVCEGAERYSASVVATHEYTVSAACDLQCPHVAPDSIPRLSDSELALPGQYFRPFDSRAPIRWAWSFELTSREERLLPLVMSHLYPRAWTTERFWNPISTGLAVHTDPNAAIVAGVCEVVERDAIALTWLLRRRLPKIRFGEADLELFDPAARYFLSRTEEFSFFDATTDIGLPTIYLVRRRPRHPFAATVVSCATAFSYAEACYKSLRESISTNLLLDSGILRVAEETLDFSLIHEGAAFMAQPRMADAFSFIDGNAVDFSALLASEPKCDDAPIPRIRWIAGRMRDMAMEVYLSDVTSRELRRAGLHCYRAVIPGLMPMSVVARARFLGTPRLHEMARAMGHVGDVDSFVNPLPQPFA
ncbi:MAG: YcaO-like family protein [Burkholderiales bacterium]